MDAYGFFQMIYTYTIYVSHILAVSYVYKIYLIVLCLYHMYICMCVYVYGFTNFK